MKWVCIVYRDYTGDDRKWRRDCFSIQYSKNDKLILTLLISETHRHPPFENRYTAPEREKKQKYAGYSLARAGSYIGASSSLTAIIFIRKQALFLARHTFCDRSLSLSLSLRNNRRAGFAYIHRGCKFDAAAQQRRPTRSVYRQLRVCIYVRMCVYIHRHIYIRVHVRRRSLARADRVHENTPGLV